MNTCNVCTVGIDTSTQNEVLDNGVPMHEICHRLMNNLDVPCKICKLSITGRNGLIRNVEGEGLCKFHVACYRCAECGAFTNLKIFQYEKNAIPFCDRCSKCYTCHNINYFKCQIDVKDDNPTRTFIITCGACLGLEQDTNIDDIDEMLDDDEYWK